MSDLVDTASGRTERLTAYLLGMLSRAERADVEAELRESAEAVAELAALSETLGMLALTPEPWSATDLEVGKRRLLDALTVEVDEGRAPWAEAPLQAFFDLSASAVRAIIDRARHQASWEPGLIPGMSLLHLRPGPRWATADAGLVKLAEGLVFPQHSHLGIEISMVLEGELEFDDGRILRAGEELRMEAGSTHSYRVRGSQCVFALVLHQGIRMGPNREDEVRTQR